MARQNYEFAGKLVFVVGGSGVGKDSLLIGAQNELEGDARFHFPKRLITRQAVAELEDHDTITFDDYTRLVIEGEAALNWQAHGLGYIIPKAIDEKLRAGKIVVCNVSRSIIAQAAQIYPVHIAEIVADLDLRAKRLANRGRETEDDIKQRLARTPIELPAEVPFTQIPNNSSLHEGIRALITLLRTLSEQTLSK